MEYRRSFVPGRAFFFTANLADRSSHLLTNQITTLRSSIRQVITKHPFEIVAMVVLPDHLHAIFTLPPDDQDYPLRWSLIKANFSRSLGKHEAISRSRAN